MTKSVANYGFEGEGVEPPTKFSKRGGGSLKGSHFPEGVAGKEGVTFSRGVG